MFCVATWITCNKSGIYTPKSHSFIDLKGKLDLKVKRVLQASDLALVFTEWSFSGTGPDDNPFDMAAKSADVLRQQADGTWKFIIDNPWGTD